MTAFDPTSASSLVELLVRRAEAHPDRLACAALASDGAASAEWSYGEVDRRARRVASALRRRGVQPSDRVLILIPTSLDFVAAFFGCLYAGAIAVPACPPRSARRLAPLERLAADAGVRQVLAMGALATMLEPLAPGRVLAVEAIDGDGSPPVEVGRDTVAMLQYTSGSTSEPKGVVLTHGNVLADEAMITASFGHDERTRVATWLPLYHDMGLIGTLLNPIFAGGSTWLMDPLLFAQRPVRWLQAIARWRVTTTGAPNFAYDFCCERVPAEQRDGIDLASWSVAFCGAEPIRAATLDRFAEGFARSGFRREAFLPCYGLAEATLLVTGRASGSGATTLRTPEGRTLVGCGSPWSGLDVVVVSPETGHPAEQTGEIWVRGPSVARGYWNRPDATAVRFGGALPDSGPYLRTGDLGFFHQGELFVTGRLDDLLIIDGRNHHPQDLEESVQRAHPRLAGRMSAAFAVEPGDRPELVIVQETERVSEAEAAEIVRAVRSAVSAHDVHARAVLLVPTGAIPRTTSGKVRRKACRDEFVAGTLIERRVRDERR